MHRLHDGGVMMKLLVAIRLESEFQEWRRMETWRSQLDPGNGMITRHYWAAAVKGWSRAAGRALMEAL